MDDDSNKKEVGRKIVKAIIDRINKEYEKDFIELWDLMLIFGEDSPQVKAKHAELLRSLEG